MDDKLTTGRLALARYAQIFWCYLRYLFRRVEHDRLTVAAGSMAYVTLLSLVPMITVLFSALSISPVFAGVSEILQDFVIENFVPTAGVVVKQYLNEFVANAGKTTAVGLLALFVVALMLISSIDGALNYIWRIRNKRRKVFSFSIYWMLLTLGPLLLGTSVAISSYLASLSWFDSLALHSLWQKVLSVLPVLMSSLAFLGLYVFVPNTQVRLLHACIGAFVASCLFEFGKAAFALYLSNFPSYQLIYGALAVIPILFVWIYLCWCIVLLGAEITASLGEHEQWWPQNDD